MYRSKGKKEKGKKNVDLLQGNMIYGVKEIDKQESTCRQRCGIDNKHLPSHHLYPRAYNKGLSQENPLIGLPVNDFVYFQDEN